MDFRSSYIQCLDVINLVYLMTAGQDIHLLAVMKTNDQSKTTIFNACLCVYFLKIPSAAVA